jgi:hypothetical protein
VLRWHWRFGGGGSGEGAHVRHRFAAKRRNASVTALDASGAEASARVGCPQPRTNNAAPRHRRRRAQDPGARFTG